MEYVVHIVVTNIFVFYFFVNFHCIVNIIELTSNNTCSMLSIHIII